MFTQVDSLLMERCVLVENQHTGDVDVTERLSAAAGAADSASSESSREVLVDEIPLFSTFVDSYETRSDARGTFAWQVLSTNPEVLARLLVRRLGDWQMDELDGNYYAVAWMRAVRVISDAVMASGADQQPLSFGAEPPFLERYHVARADVAGQVQCIDGVDRWWPAQAHSVALPAADDGEHTGDSSVYGPLCGSVGSDLIYTIDECNALVLDSLRWRARSWMHVHPPSPTVHLNAYYQLYTEANTRHLDYAHFSIVAAERYEVPTGRAFSSGTLGAEI